MAWQAKAKQAPDPIVKPFERLEQGVQFSGAINRLVSCELARPQEKLGCIVSQLTRGTSKSTLCLIHFATHTAMTLASSLRGRSVCEHHPTGLVGEIQ